MVRWLYVIIFALFCAALSLAIYSVIVRNWLQLATSVLVGVTAIMLFENIRFTERAKDRWFHDPKA